MPTIIRLPQASTPNRITGAIASAAQATGVDFAYMLGQARLESGLNPAAKARTSSATGLYQFIDQTWLATLKQHAGEHGLGWAANSISRSASGRYHVSNPAMKQAVMDLRKNPEAAALMAGEFAADNRAHLEKRLGRKAEPVDLYLAHFLGAGGATQFLRGHAANPDAPAAPILPRAAAANRSIFCAKNGRARSFDEIRQRFAAKLGGAATVPNAPASQRSVQPADYLRLATAAPQHESAALPVARPSTDSFSAMLSPARARLAYLLLAGMDMSA